MLSELNEEQSLPNVTQIINFFIVLFGLLLIVSLWSKQKRTEAEESINWNKYEINSAKPKRTTQKNNPKSSIKLKGKARTKALPKEKITYFSTIFDTKAEKEESRSERTYLATRKSTSASQEEYLDNVEKENLKDQLEEQIYCTYDSFYLESFYINWLKENFEYVQFNVNEKLNGEIIACLNNDILNEKEKAIQILDLFLKLSKEKKKALHEKTYHLIIEILLRTRYFSCVLFILSLVERFRIKLPKGLLELFIETSINAENNCQKEFSEELTLKLKKKFKDELTTREFAEAHALDFVYNHLDSEARDEFQMNNYKIPTPKRKAAHTNKFDEAVKVKQSDQISSSSTNFEDLDKLVKEQLKMIDFTKVKEFYPRNYVIVQKY